MAKNAGIATQTTTATQNALTAADGQPGGWKGDWGGKKGDPKGGKKGDPKGGGKGKEGKEGKPKAKAKAEPQLQQVPAKKPLKEQPCLNTAFFNVCENHKVPLMGELLHR